MKHTVLLAAASVVTLFAVESTAQAARVDLCKLQASQLNARALSGIAHKGCPYYVSVASLQGGAGGGYIVGSLPPGSTTPGGTTPGTGTSIVDVNTDGGINAGVLGGATDNTGGVNAGVLGGSTGNTGGINVGVGSNTASNNTGGINVDAGGNGTGAGSNNSGGINAGVGGPGGISAHVGSSGVSVSVGKH